MGRRLTAARAAMGLVRPKPPALPPVRMKMPGIGGELADSDLQQVIGGLARTWIDDDVLSDQRDLAPPQRK